MSKTSKSKLPPLDIDTLWKLQRIGSPALAPDGRHAVVTVTTPSMADNALRSSLWLLPTERAAPRLLTRCGDKDGQPAWSPIGDRIAFVAKREWHGVKDATPQLYVIAADGGEAERVSDFAPGIESFKWMPDGQRMVFAAWVWPELKAAAAQQKRWREFEARKETGYASSEAYHRYFDHSMPMGRVLHLLLLDLRNGRVTDLFEGSALELTRDAAGSTVYDVHPGGHHIAFAHDPAIEAMLGNRIVLSELTIGAKPVVTRLADDLDWDFGDPRYSPDGQQLACTACQTGRAHTALAQLAIVNRGARAAEGRVARGARGSAPNPQQAPWRALGDGMDLSIDAPLRWAADGDAVLFTAQRSGCCHLWRCAVADGALSVVHEGGWVQGFDTAGDTTVLAADSAQHPVRVLVRPGGAKPRRLETFNDEVLDSVALGEVREVQITGAQGAPVQMWLTFPPAFEPKRKHPLNQVIHGGPFAAAGDTFSWRWNPHVLASRGAVVAQVNYHGSSGFGFAFRHSLIGRQGELELQDIEAGTDWLLAQKWADTKRVCATGGSYGGFLVAWMNGHLPAWPVGRYRAYVCHAGVFDRVATFSADSYPERPKDLAATYWDDLPRVLAQSPATFAARMQTPTLVIHGAKDYRVPDCNGLAYYNTLKARGVDARLLWFADENHWVLKPRNSKQWTTEFLDWLDAHAPAKAAAGAKRKSNKAAKAKPTEV
ncbi:MAG: S9 family peptidase [Rubrivivax sp.]